MAETSDPEMLAQMILLAAAQHNLETLRQLLKSSNGAANVQDPETGYTPLHAAISACAPDEDDEEDEKRETAISGDKAEGNEGVEEWEEAKKTLRVLLQNGAIWNDLDKNNETPGCIAHRLGLQGLYDIIVDAGVRAEMLLNRLDEYEELEEDDEEEEQPGEVSEEKKEGLNEEQQKKEDVNSKDFLASELTYTNDRLVDADKNGVMMAWETDIMKKSVDRLVPQDGLRILNIGHGMGIVDDLFQQKQPSAHHIVEAHPAVQHKMVGNGWDTKPNVTIHNGKWQDILPRLVEQNTMFDVIYFDTFAEDYSALRTFFSEHVIGLLDPQGIDGNGGRWGFFNGLGADRQVCYDVYTKVVEMDLFEAGFETEWDDIEIPDLDKSDEWHGVRRKYWALDRYRLPTCRFLD